MNTIIFPTDFSETANNALQTAKNVAKNTNATLHLCHFYTLALNNYTAPESMIPLELLEDIKVTAINELDKIKEALVLEGFKVECTVNGGDLVVEILDLAENTHADLIVMGTTGANNFINKLIGSNALSIMQKSKCPVILVPNNYKNKTKIDKIVFADHFDADNSQIIQEIASFADKMQVSAVDVLSVNTEYNFNVVNDTQTIDSLVNTLGENKVKLNFVEAANFVDGFKQYAENHQVDLLIMSTRKKTLLQRLFTDSQTKLMAEHGQTPLMIYHI